MELPFPPGPGCPFPPALSSPAATGAMLLPRLKLLLFSYPGRARFMPGYRSTPPTVWSWKSDGFPGCAQRRPPSTHSFHHGRDTFSFCVRSFAAAGAYNGAPLRPPRFCRSCPTRPRPARRASAFPLSSNVLSPTGLLLARNCLDARDVPPDLAHSRRVFKLARGGLEAQVELLLLQVRQLLIQLVE